MVEGKTSGSAEMGPGRVWQGHSLRGRPTHPHRSLSWALLLTEATTAGGTIQPEAEALGRPRSGLLAAGPTAEGQGRPSGHHAHRMADGAKATLGVGGGQQEGAE